MMLMSHLAISLVVSKVVGLNGQELLAAMIGGTILDLDHFLMFYKRKKDTPGFWQKLFEHNGQINLHSWLHEPLAGGIFGLVISFLLSYINPQIHWWIFPMFVLGHILLDLMMKFEHHFWAPFGRKRVFGLFKSGTKKEFAFSSLTLWLIIILIR